MIGTGSANTPAEDIDLLVIQVGIKA